MIPLDPFAQFSASRRVVKPAVAGAGGVVVAQNRVAASVGADVLAKGGNAVDAAIATAFALDVVEPWMSGIGGGGALLVARPGDTVPTVVDFSMVAPAALDPADYPLGEGASSDLFGWPLVKGNRNVVGPGAVAVPGAVDGYGLALERFGSWSWADVIAPAVRLAEDGLPCDWFTILQIARAAAELAAFPASREAFLPNGHPPVEGMPPVRIPRGAQAATLRALSEGGRRAFYEGPLADRIAADVQAAGGVLTSDDMAGYRAEIRRPLSIAFAGGVVHGLPELSGGPTMARVLKALDGKLPDRPDADAHVAMAEALFEAFADRFARMGDEAGRRGEACTTHVSVVGGDGTLVTLTTTLLSVFGSRLVLPGTGVLMNNGINWFDPRPGRPNSLGPGKRPLCNYNPAIIARDDGRGFALGASGGRKIIGAVTQLVIYLTRFGMGVEDALAYPRFDVSGTQTLMADPRFADGVRAALRARFDTVAGPLSVLPNNYACPSIVARVEGAHRGGADPIHPWAEAIAVQG